MDNDAEEFEQNNAKKVDFDTRSSPYDQCLHGRDAHDYLIPTRQLASASNSAFTAHGAGNEVRVCETALNMVDVTGMPLRFLDLMTSNSRRLYRVRN